jgi:hypothetical protein
VLSGLHGVIFEKILFRVTAVRTWSSIRYIQWYVGTNSRQQLLLSMFCRRPLLRVRIVINLGELKTEVRFCDVVSFQILPEVTQWSRGLLEKLLKKFAAFNGTRRFITMFSRACLRSLSCARWI